MILDMNDVCNRLYYGDCYAVLQKHIPSESVDLIYLDPPFNSNRDYNVLFKEQSGAPAEAQVKAFTDTWKWSPDLYAEWDAFVDTCPNQPLVSLMQSFIQYLKRNDVTAYLARMAPRLYELHRVLKPTGSLYLHCDSSASHYLKVLLDLIFGATHFKSEIIWQRTFNAGSSKSIAKKWPAGTDTILYYTKSDLATFHQTTRPYSVGALKRYDKVDDQGRRFKWNPLKTVSKERLEALLASGEAMITASSKYPVYKHYFNEEKGAPVDTLWIDLPHMGTHGDERLGYPTQKPVALLKRVLEASSNPGDVVLDPFCGCGTTIMAAQELGRNWIGIDITSTATSLIEARLFDTFHIHNGPKGDYDIIGLPTTDAEAIELASRDKHEFQKWAISLVPRAMPWQEKKGADGGVDGFVRFKFPPSFYKAGEEKKTELVIISVKGGQTVKMDDIKNLEATMTANKAAMGFLITLVPPTKGIVDWANKSGFVKSPDGGNAVPVIQIRTVAQLLRGEAFAFPWNSTVHGIPKAGVGQGGLDLDI